MIVLEQPTQTSPELVAAFARLVPQLSRSSPVPSPTDLESMLASPVTRLLIARDGAGGQIVGSLTVVLFRIPTGLRAWIEDVVVDESARGRGVGELLTQEAIRLAGE